MTVNTKIPQKKYLKEGKRHFILKSGISDHSPGIRKSPNMAPFKHTGRDNSYNQEEKSEL